MDVLVLTATPGDHPLTIVVAERLGVPRYAAVGLLVELAGTLHRHGLTLEAVPELAPEVLNAWAGHPGLREAIVDGLRSLGRLAGGLVADEEALAGLARAQEAARKRRAYQRTQALPAASAGPQTAEPPLVLPAAPAATAPERRRRASAESPESLRRFSGEPPETLRRSSGEPPASLRRTSGEPPETGGETPEVVALQAVGEVDQQEKTQGTAVVGFLPQTPTSPHAEAQGVSLSPSNNPGITKAGVARVPTPLRAEQVRERITAFFADLAGDTSKRVSREELRRVGAEMVFAYWQHVHGHPKALLDEKRLRLAMRRLRESGDNLGELLYALDGARRDQYVAGEGRSAGQRHDDFDFLLRDRGAVEKYAALVPDYRNGLPHPRAAMLEEAIRGTGKAKAEPEPLPPATEEPAA